MGLEERMLIKISDMDQTGFKGNEFSLKRRWLSLRFAYEGVRLFFNEEHNARVHGVATIAVMLACWVFGVTTMQLVALVIVTGMVWTAEIFNTAIERAMDFISPGQHPSIKVVKDLGAAAVLVTSLMAVITALIIFIPKIF
jgi:diacylglycerol kinase